jgi:hypothetical protein
MSIMTMQGLPLVNFASRSALLQPQASLKEKIQKIFET